MVYQLEISDTGTEHIQGYVALQNRIDSARSKEYFRRNYIFQKKNGTEKRTQESIV